MSASRKWAKWILSWGSLWLVFPVVALLLVGCSPEVQPVSESVSQGQLIATVSATMGPVQVFTLCHHLNRIYVVTDGSQIGSVTVVPDPSGCWEQGGIFRPSAEPSPKPEKAPAPQHQVEPSRLTAEAR